MVKYSSFCTFTQKEGLYSVVFAFKIPSFELKPILHTDHCNIWRHNTRSDDAVDIDNSIRFQEIIHLN